MKPLIKGICMRMKLRLEGFPEATANEIVKKGKARSASGAIALALTNFGECHGIAEKK